MWRAYARAVRFVDLFRFNNRIRFASVLSIHRVKRGDDVPTTREVQILNTELQQIMKGNFETCVILQSTKSDAFSLQIHAKRNL